MTQWTIDPASPVIVPGQMHGRHDARRAGAAHVVQLGDRYRMVYWGTDADGRHVILQAEAPVEQPNRWTPIGGPLIGPQSDKPYNTGGPSFPFLLPVTETYWLLYFCAWGSKRPDGRLPNTTGVAISEDAGRSWRYVADNPIIPLDRPYDQKGTGSLWVLLENGRFRMYYTAIGAYGPKPEGVTTGHGDTIPRIGIAYAESEDGLHWSKPAPELLVSPRGFDVEPYEYICSKPCVVRDESGYVLWVNTFGTAYRVHRLTSRDGLHWTWASRVGPEGELGAGAPSAFDDHQRSYPTVIPYRDQYRCWYTGNGFGTTGMGYAVSRLSG
ncbi:MAG: hypothetical protein HY343_10530 [Lentisphaerae bacterium]|nr:hypothetical protein [Lentisphaerota bacterium]